MIQLCFDDFPHLLSSEIEDRKASRKGFEETELWYLLYSLAQAKAQMNPAFSKVGDLRPHNIFVNEKSQVRVANLLSWPRESTNYSKAFENEVTYLGTNFLMQPPNNSRNSKSAKSNPTKLRSPKSSPWG